MNDNTSEIEKEYIEFCNNVDKAIAECKMEGSVSKEVLHDIYDSFVSLGMKILDKLETDKSTLFIDKMVNKVNYFASETNIKLQIKEVDVAEIERCIIQKHCVNVNEEQLKYLISLLQSIIK